MINLKPENALDNDDLLFPPRHNEGEELRTVRQLYDDDDALEAMSSEGDSDESSTDYGLAEDSDDDDDIENESHDSALDEEENIEEDADSDD